MIILSLAPFWLAITMASNDAADVNTTDDSVSTTVDANRRRSADSRRRGTETTADPNRRRSADSRRRGTTDDTDANRRRSADSRRRGTVTTAAPEDEASTAGSLWKVCGSVSIVSLLSLLMKFFMF